MNFSLGEVLHMVGQAIRTPCLIVLLFLIVLAVWQVGELIVEYLTERRKLKADVPTLLQEISQNEARLDKLIDESGLLKRQKAVLHTLEQARGMSRVSMTALAQRLLATEEARYGKTTSVTDMGARLGPMFGLLGTLIPLGPGIVALGKGDTATLAQSIGLAFDTTIAGLISAAVFLLVSNIRKRWYDDDMVSLETLMDCIVEEVSTDAEK